DRLSLYRGEYRSALDDRARQPRLRHQDHGLHRSQCAGGSGSRLRAFGPALGHWARNGPRGLASQARARYRCRNTGAVDLADDGGEPRLCGRSLRARVAAEPMSDRVLITGASGFVGSAVARAAARRGLAVRVLVRSTSPRANLAELD